MKIELFHVKLPMKFEFVTAKSALKIRETLIVKLTDNDKIGYGECVAFTEPFYTAETLDSAWNYLSNLTAFPEFDSAHKMAFAAIENAQLALKFGKQNFVGKFFEQNLATQIEKGAVLGDLSEEILTKKIDKLSKNNVHRIKLKASPKNLEIISNLVKKFPKLNFAVDGNQSLSSENLQFLDDLGLIFIEEPLSSLTDYPENLKTSIAFDESVQNLSDLGNLPKNVQKIVNLKIGRLGGLAKTKEMIELCAARNIKTFVGSMVESSISKHLHAQLAALPNQFCPGDLSESDYYFEEDLTNPALIFDNGKMDLPEKIVVNEALIEKHTIRKHSHEFD